MEAKKNGEVSAALIMIEEGIVRTQKEILLLVLSRENDYSFNFIVNHITTITSKSLTRIDLP
jgi:hypothetical protein